MSLNWLESVVRLAARFTNKPVVTIVRRPDRGEQLKSDGARDSRAGGIQIENSLGSLVQQCLARTLPLGISGDYA